MRTAELKLFQGNGMTGTRAPAGIEKRAIRRIGYIHFVGPNLALIIFIIGALITAQENEFDNAAAFS